MLNFINKVIFHSLKYSTLIFQIIYSLTIQKIIKKKYVVTKYKNYKKHKFIFLYVGFIEKKFDISYLNILSEAKKKNCYIVYVNNCKNFIPTNDLKNIIDVYINNHDSGWDFSLYKTGTDYIFNELKNCSFKKIIYANDSVFYFKKNINFFLNNFLDLKHDLIVTFENSGMGKYHYSSWFFSIEKKIFINKKYLNFFKNIFDIKNKYYSIHFGEHRLSKVLIDINPKTKIIYSNSFLINSLKKNFGKISDYITVFDSTAFKDFYNSRINLNLTNKTFLDWLKLNLWLYSPAHFFNNYLFIYEKFPVLKKDLIWNNLLSYSSLNNIFNNVYKLNNKEYFQYIRKYYLLRGRLQDAPYIRKFYAYLGLRA
jgi:hypothetical protein